MERKMQLKSTLNKFVLYTFAAFIVLSGFHSTLVANVLADQTHYNQSGWELSISLGELPHQTFKPGVSTGYHWNRFLYTGLIFQTPNVISRDGDSFNASSIGLDGIVSSWETVGYRALAEIRITPILYGPYLSAGVVTNRTDTEHILFDQRTRTIGSSSYTTDVEIIQKRNPGVVPAVGIGWSVLLKNGITIGTGFTMGFFTDMPEPDITIKSSAVLSDSDKKSLKTKTRSEYMDNFHNRYHIFTMGVGIRFRTI
jgi:hypothetical protein